MRPYRSAFIVTALVVRTTFMASAASAHAFDPNVLQIFEHDDGRVAVAWTTSTPSTPPRLLEGCVSYERPEPPAKPREPRTVTRWWLQCEPSDLDGGRISIEGPSADTDTIVRLHRADGALWTNLVRAGGGVLALPRRDSTNAVDVAIRYLALGVEHIAFGIDHLLFVLGLWLLVPTRRALGWTITAFTVGHSATLALATLDIFTVRGPPVEVLIALSIMLVAREVVVEPAADQTVGRLQRLWLGAVGFGLLHGFGFAGALQSVGIPTAQATVALAAFNVGVELGQLAFVLVLAAVTGGFERLRRPFTLAGRQVVAYAMGASATVWVVERVLQLGT